MCFNVDFVCVELFSKFEELRSQSDTVDCVGQLLLDWVSRKHAPVLLDFLYCSIPTYTYCATCTSVIIFMYWELTLKD